MKPAQNKKSDPPNRKPSLPTSIDQGWATLIAAVITLAGAIIVGLWTIKPQATSSATPAATIAISSPTITTSIEQTVTSSPTPSPTVTDTPGPLSQTIQPVLQPTVQIPSNLSPSVEQTLQAAASGILQAAKLLPLIMRDNFETNDYGWYEFQDTFEKGIQCSATIKEGKFSIAVQSTSTSGAAWCIPYAPRSAGEFYLSFDMQLVQERNTNVFLYYRHVDENNFYYLVVTPETQSLTWGIRLNGKEYVFTTTFIPAIQKAGSNKITLLVLGGSHTLYINDQLVASVSNESSLTHGQIRLGIRLNEAEQNEELLIDDFELRGN